MTQIDEIADGIYGISTKIDIPVGSFSFNQYLIADDEPLLFHTGMLRPTAFACMHGSAWRGDRARVLRALADSLERG